MQIAKNKQLGKVLGVVLAIGVSAIGMVAIAAQPDARTFLESEYKTQKQIAVDALNKACEYEVSLAKIKLADHYMGKDKVDVAKLTDKADGKNLDCRNF